MLRFKNVTKTFGQYVVLDRINLNLAPDRTHVLLGQSGSGKSTLIRIAAGLIEPDSGESALDGRPSQSIASKDRAALFGFMVQDGGLFPHLNCRDNVLLPARVHNMPLEKTRSRLQELASMVGITEPLLRRYPREVSGGQKQRIALMRALILNPPLLFLDEPLGALDPMVRSDLQRELKAIFKKLKKTVVIVTHDLSEAAYFADSIALLRAGHIEQHGKLQDFLKFPKSQFVKDYFQAQRPPPGLRLMNNDSRRRTT